MFEVRPNLVPRSHSVTGNVRSGKVRQYTIFHLLLKKGCGNAIYARIGLFRGALSEGLVFASSCAVLNKCQLCGGKFCFFRRRKSLTVEENHMNHVSVSPTDGNGPTQGQRKTLTRVGIEPTTFGLDHRCSS